MKKRVIAWLLMLCMLLTAVPAMAATCNHDYARTRTLRAGTCTVKGVYQETCILCGSTRYVSDYAHDMQEVFIDATCTEPAMIGEECSLCHLKTNMKPVEGSEALGHKMVPDPDLSEPADCELPGLEVEKCDNGCGLTTKKVIPATGHTPVGDPKHKDATCDKPSGVEYKCATCGGKVFEAYPDGVGEPAKGHKYTSEVVAPTCTEGGFTIYTCSVCGDNYTANVTKPDANAHPNGALDVAVVRAATCTTNGIGKYTCLACKKSLGYKVIPAAHTNPQEYEVVEEATCGKAGKTTYFCGDCGEFYDVTIPATKQHIMDDYYFDATCTAPAKVGYVCLLCGYAKPGDVEEIGEPLGHDLVLDPTNKDYVAATCVKGGVDTLKCSRCDYTETKKTAALGHEWDDGKHHDADCVNPAGVMYTCSTCGATKVDAYTEAGLAKPALGHKYEVEKVPATCQTAGYTSHFCTRCGDYYKDAVTAVNPNAHNPELVGEALRPATHKTNGIGKYVCADCDKTLGYKVIPAGHDWELIDEVPATCGTEGSKTYVCTRDTDECDMDGMKVETVPATGKHSWADEAEYYPATCTEPAMIAKKCTLCGATGEAEVIPGEGNEALGHKMMKDEGNPDAKEATCTKGGVEVSICLRCGYVEKKNTEPKGHAWDDGVYTAPTCTAGAGVLYTCTVPGCGETKVDEFTGALAEPALGHKDKVVVTAPTCTKEGFTTSTCERCDDVRVTNKTKPVATAHVQDDENAYILKPASCTANGIGKFVCRDCGKDLGYKVIPGGHKWEEYVVSEADCIHKGETYRFCTNDNCGENETIYTPTTGKHTMVSGKTIDATCTSPAMVGEVCAVCGATGTATPVPGSVALGHKYELDKTNKDYVAATCEEGGVDTLVCVNGCHGMKKEVTKPLGHTWVELGHIHATCEFASGVEYICSVCSKTKVEEDPADIAEPALGHKYVEDVIEATCKDKGLAIYTCAYCGDQYEEELPVDPEAHVWNRTVVKAGTCTTSGVERWSCAVCGKTKYETTAPAHDWSEEKTDNHCVYKVCKKCDKVEIVAVLEGFDCTEMGMSHKPVAGKPVEPTCTEAGKKADTVCSVCGVVIVEGEAIAALGHTMVELEGTAVEATCTTPGKKADTDCSVCKNAFVMGEVIAALGHTEVAVEGSAVEATCTNPGKKADTKCSVCGIEMSTGAVVDALGHDIVADAAVAATCTTDGKTAGEHCTRCDYKVAQEVIKAEGHKIVADAAVAATCTEDGKTAGEHCTVCDYKVGQEVIKAKGHTFKISYSLSEDGTMRVITKTCKVCGYKEVTQEAI